LVVIDTLTAALGGGSSDSDPKDVSALITHIQTYLLKSCTVLLLHHFGKDTSRGARGWSGLRASLDFEMEIDVAADGLRTLRLTKNRDGSDRQPAMCFQFVGRGIGTDEDGDVLTAVVVEHLADEEDKPARGKRISPKARAALNVLWEMIKDPARSFPMPDSLLSDGRKRRAVLVEDWEQACIEPGAITKAAVDRDRRKKFRLAKEELEAADEIACDSDDRRVYPAEKGGV
jgi:hypothetical protein